MRIEYLHASRFGNGAAVAEEFRKQMAARRHGRRSPHQGGEADEAAPRRPLRLQLAGTHRQTHRQHATLPHPCANPCWDEVRAPDDRDHAPTRQVRPHSDARGACSAAARPADHERAAPAKGPREACRRCHSRHRPEGPARGRLAGEGRVLRVGDRRKERVLGILTSVNPHDAGGSRAVSVAAQAARSSANRRRRAAEASSSGE